MLLCVAASGLLKAENDKPFVIPELRQWQGADGMVAINAKSKVVYVNDELADVAEAMAEDYGLLFGQKLKTKAASKASEGSIIMVLTDDKELGDEGYSIEIGDAVAISANTATGAYAKEVKWLKDHGYRFEYNSVNGLWKAVK